MTWCGVWLRASGNSFRVSNNTPVARETYAKNLCRTCFPPPVAKAPEG